MRDPKLATNLFTVDQRSEEIGWEIHAIDGTMETTASLRESSNGYVCQAMIDMDG